MATNLDYNVNTNAGQAVNQFKALKNALKDATGELAGLAIGTAEYNAAAEKVGSLRDRVNELNDSIRATSGAPVENLTNSFGLLSGQVNSLDFDGAANSLGQFAGQIKTFSFKDLLGGIKSIGKSFLDLGKALLSNPIFIFVGVLTGIGVAIYELKDKVKFISDIFDGLGAIVDGVVNTFKNLSDTLFGTGFAAQDAAEKTIKASQATANAVEDRYNREIKIAKAAGKDTTTLEKQKQDDIIATNKAVIKGLNDYIIAGGKLNDEQKKLLEQSTTNVKNAYTELEVAQAEANAKYEAKQKAIYKLTQDLSINNFKEGQSRELEVLRRQQEAQLEGLKATEAYGRNREAIEKVFAEQRQAIINKYSKITSDKQKADNDRLIKQTEDENINAIKDEEQRAIAQAATVKERRDKDINDSKASINVKKEALIASEKQLQIETDAIVKTFADKRKADKDKELADAIALNNTKLTAEADYQVAKAEADNVYNQADTEALINQLTVKKDIELSNATLTAEQKLLIEQNYSNAVNQIKIDDAEKARQLRLREADDALNVASSLTSSLASLADTVYKSKSANLKKGSKEEEEAAKKQFKVQKALALVGAIIDGAKAVVTSLASAPLAIGPAPNPIGIASLAATILASVASVAKIASTQYQSNGGSGGGSTGAGAASSVSAAPSGIATNGPVSSQFNSDAINQSGSVNGQSKDPNGQRVYVLESDITNAQNRVKTIVSQSTIG